MSTMVSERVNFSSFVLSLLRYGVAIFSLTLIVLHLQGVSFSKEITPSQIRHEKGFAFTAQVGELRWFLFSACADSASDPTCSTVELFENGKKLSGAHTQHRTIRELGRGYSLWDTTLYFASSDRRDPRRDKRKYLLVAEGKLPQPLFWALIVVLLFLLRSEIADLVAGVGVTFGRRSAIGLLFAVASVVCMYLCFVGVPKTVHLETEKISATSGFGYAYPLVKKDSYFSYVSDSATSRAVSPTEVRENGTPLSSPHSQGKAIENVGMGRYSHWNNILYFSSTDGTDPRTNGRKYTANVQMLLSLNALFISVGALTLVGLFGACKNGEFRKACGFGMLGAAALWGCTTLSGALYWVVLGVGTVLAVMAIGSILSNALHPGMKRGVEALFGNLALVVGSIIFTLTLAEVFLFAAERSGLPVSQLSASLSAKIMSNRDESTLGARFTEGSKEASVEDLERAKRYRSQVEQEALELVRARSAMLALPPEWILTPITLQGASSAYTWHNAVHVYDSNGFRRIGEFPKKSPGVFRIVTVGDSLTYGIGVEEKWTYPSILQRELSKGYKVEVLNLGVSGFQSEDIAHVVKKFVPILTPDLVVYGVCLNDFLPSGASQGEPAPFTVPNYLLEHTRLGQLFSRGLDAFFVTFGYMKSFHGQILEKFEEYRVRFAKDVSAMGAFVRDAGLPPPVGMVLTQNPDVRGVNYELTRVAETALSDAGFVTVDPTGYHAAFAGESFRVSPWEGHPNEEAQSIFAFYLRDEIVKTGLLKKYKK